MTGCFGLKKIKDGKTAFDTKQYAIAIDLLLSDFEKTNNKQTKSRNAYMLGVSYGYLEETQQAIEWLKKAVRSDYGAIAELELAKAYKKNGDYKLAIKSYEIMRHAVNDTRLIDREIFVLNEVIKWGNVIDQSVSINLLNENSGYSEYAAVIYNKDLIVFTSDQGESTGNESYNWTGNKHSDLFVMMKNGSNVKRFDASINSKFNDGTACFSKDFQEIIFTRCITSVNSDAFCELYYSMQSEGVWSDPKKMSFFEGEQVNVGQATFIEHDSVLVFVANRQEGQGGHDLYYSERLFSDDGSISWSAPSIMPPTINTKGNDMFPSGDGDTLYYSSDYLEGLGGLDIFKTWLLPNGQWVPPQNLKKPINSSADDFSYVVDNFSKLRKGEIQKGFFTSNRKGEGKEDLYSYVRKGTKVLVEDPNTIKIEADKILEVYFAGKTKQVLYMDDFDPTSRKNLNGTLANCKVEISNSDTLIVIESDANGQFILQLERDNKYKIVLSKNGFFNEVSEVSTYNLEYPPNQISTTINKAFILDRIFENIEIDLDNIYYNFNKWEIRDDAKPTLDSLSTLLIDNPQIKIQLSSHTDCRGEIDYNQVLSQKRAESAVSYISQKGIEYSRMIAKGYGESAPSVICICNDCTEEDHQKNRRTTFKVLN